MWFKNLMLYRLPAGWQRTAAELEATLSQFPLKPCIGQAEQTHGWVALSEAGERVYGSGKQLLIALGSEEKLLPSSVVAQATAERVRELEQQKGYKVGRKLKQDVKEQVRAELLPRAFTRQRETRGWLDFEQGWLVLDTSSTTRADDFTQTLRTALGELPVTPLQCEPALSTQMTQWLAAHAAPGRFDLGDECELTATDENKATVRYVRHALDGKDVAGHLSRGKQVTRMALNWNGRIRFVVDDKLVMKRVKFLDMDEAPRDAVDAELQREADFTLMCGEFGALLEDFTRAIHAARD